MGKRDLLKLPDDFEGNMRALLATPPAPHGTAGSRKTAPKPPPKARKATKRKARKADYLDAIGLSDERKEAKRKAARR